MKVYKKSEIRVILNEVGKVCGREQRSTEPIIDYVDFLVDKSFEEDENGTEVILEDEWETLSSRAKSFITYLCNIKIENQNYRNKWIRIFKKAGFVFAEKNQSNSADRRLENEKRRGKPAGIRLMELMIEHGIETGEGQLVAYLEKEGYQYSKTTAHTIRAAFRQAIIVLAGLGYLSKMPKQ